jgi:hypothetical protein
LKLNYQVKTAEAGRTAEKFLRQNLGFSRGMVRRLKRTGGVLVDRKSTRLNSSHT